MLIFSKRSRCAPRSNQTGVTLVITLIVLVAMTLATIALMRSVDTTNIIAGNLAFQQAASHAADAGAEEAARTLLPKIVTDKQLSCIGTACPKGYISWRNPKKEPPTLGQTWDSWWNYVSSITTPIVIPSSPFDLGNSVSYVVESVCDADGQDGECAKSPPSMSGGCSGSDLGAVTQQCISITRRYFRVTSRVQGPRNSVSYIQTILAM
jgi:type IV pilus assembly protein PilX